MPDSEAKRSDASSRERAAKSAGAGAAPERGCARRGLARARAAHPVRLEGGIDPCRPRSGAGSRRARRRRFLAQRKHHAQEHPRPARAPHCRRHGAARRHRRRAAGHLAGRAGQGVRGRRALASRRLRRYPRRSGRHGAHPRPDRLHDGARGGEPGDERQAQEAAAGRTRFQSDRSVHSARRHQDHPHLAVRAALDAGDRPARQDAGDAHSSGPGDRRIWRHRRHRFDRGHRRADRRRHRRRA